DYILNSPLNIGDKVIFKDMAIYTMVKTNTFNGMPLPDIVNMTKDGPKTIRKFNYEDFKNRL
ncbi:MAG: carboxynorspermidine decarboxylase, partial [Lachnospiraceae bacterium]|nr:carboxynorspermidine decarboxylase [Lachnospiraceae bacterium]